MLGKIKRLGTRSAGSFASNISSQWHHKQMLAHLALSPGGSPPPAPSLILCSESWPTLQPSPPTVFQQQFQQPLLQPELSGSLDTCFIVLQGPPSATHPTPSPSGQSREPPLQPWPA